jgi:hypothetical protein
MLGGSWFLLDERDIWMVDDNDCSMRLMVW